jgi:hypothetical protein
MSTIRYFPPSGTAGFARSFVNGNKRVPAPPPIMMASVRCVVPGGSAGAYIDVGFRNDFRSDCRSSSGTPSITQRLGHSATFLLL